MVQLSHRILASREKDRVLLLVVFSVLKNGAWSAQVRAGRDRIIKLISALFSLFSMILERI